jgi:hypothetical protein
MQDRKTTPRMDLNPEGSVEIDSRKTAILDQPRFRAVLPGMAAIVLVGLVIGVGAPLWVALAAGVLPVIVGAWDAGRRDQARLVVWKELTENVCALDARPLAVPAEPGWREVVADWNRDWPVVCESIVQVQRLRERTRALPQRVEQSLGSIVAAADRQEEAVEETASLVANISVNRSSFS